MATGRPPDVERERLEGFEQSDLVNEYLMSVLPDKLHRGQICSLARAHRHEFRREDITRIWGWRRLPPRFGGR